MSATTKLRMTADEFIVWAMEQPEGERYELVAGEVFAMAPERVGHALTKGLVYVALVAALRAANLRCDAFPDGISVRVDATTVYQPDAMVRCGRPLNDDATEVTDPIIVVEVLSSSSEKRDTGGKLVDYFRIPSVRHYLIVDKQRRAIVHHRLDETGAIKTAIIREGHLRLDPPGLVVTGLFDQ
jgi:Uma2 family endonuclease